MSGAPPPPPHNNGHLQSSAVAGKDQASGQQRRFEALGQDMPAVAITAVMVLLQLLNNAAKRTKLPDFDDEDEQPVQTAGLIYVLGQGDCGQLGKGEDYTEAKLPALSRLPSNLKALDIAAGGVHSLAIDADANVFSTGVNDEGALGRRTENKIWETASPSERDENESGDDTSWGPVQIRASHGLPKAVCAGDSHSTVLTDCGFIWGWGTFRDAQGVYGFQPDCQTALLPRLVYKPTARAKVVQISSGTDHIVALLDTGEVRSWGTGWQGQLGRIPKHTFREFTAAKHKYKAVKAEVEDLREQVEKETVPAHQEELQAKLKVLEPMLAEQKANFDPLEKALRKRQLSPTRVQFPSLVNMAVDDQGQAWAWGLDNYGQATGAPWQSAPGSKKEDDEKSVFEPRLVTGLKKQKIAAMAGGSHHTLALTTFGEVLAYGRTTYGRLGRLNAQFEENVGEETPELVDGLEGVAVESISAGEEVSACISKQGLAFTWGAGTNKQLGNAGLIAGSRNVGLDVAPPARKNATADEDEDLDEAIPWRVDVPSFANKRISKIEFGGQHTMLLRQE